MPVPRTIQLPSLARVDDTSVREVMRSLFTSLRNWVAETAQQLGQLQDVPVSIQSPLVGQAFVFDGERWTPQAISASGNWLAYVPIPGADGVTKTFNSPVNVALGANGKPLALIVRGVGLSWYDDADPPTLNRWHLRAGSPQTIVMGVAPQATENFGYLNVATL